MSKATQSSAPASPFGAASAAGVAAQRPARQARYMKRKIDVLQVRPWNCPRGSKFLLRSRHASRAILEATYDSYA
jgi:hypothetical protein